MELFFEAFGKSINLFFREIPTPWQPFLLILMTIVIILCLVMMCGYRLHLPFLLKIEPKTPVFLRMRSPKSIDIVDGKGKGNNSSWPEKKLLQLNDSICDKEK